MARDKDRYSKDQRYEVILDNGEDENKWSSLSDNTGTIVSGTAHITGAQSVSFDKISGSSTDAYIVRPIDRMNGSDLDAFSSEGHILSSVYLPSIADVASYNVALLMSSGTAHGAYYEVTDADLTVGWNHLKFDCATYASTTGHGVNWKEVKWLGVGVSFDSASDTLSDILIDSVRIQMPAAVVHFDPNIANVTMQSEVQIKSGNDPDELSVDAANTARTTATNVIPVQPVDATGKVAPAGEVATNAPYTALTDGTNTAAIDAANTARTTATVVQATQPVDATGKVAPAGEVATNAPFVSLTDGTNTATIDAANTARTTSTIVQATQPIDSQGNIITGGGGTSGGLTLYSSPVHFSAAYQAATALDLSGMAFTITNFSQFVEIEAWDASGIFIAKYSPKTHVFAWDSVNDRVSVTGAAFVTGGTHKVSILAEDRTISIPDDSVKTLVGNQYQLNSDDSGISLITSAQDVTTSWVDFGPEISTFGYNSLGVWVSVIRNLAAGMRIKALAKHTSAGSVEYPLVISTINSAGTVISVADYYWEFDDADGEYIISINTDGIVPYVQMQVQARDVGSTGQFSTGHYTRGWR